MAASPGDDVAEMVDRPIVVVGAGPAGLASAAELQRADLAAVVLERDAIGSSWRGRYDRLRLNSSRWTSRLPGSGHPRKAGVFPSRDDMVAYLEHYAKQKRLDVRLGMEVERVVPDDGGWSLASSAGAITASHVIVATGFERTPVIPEWPGRDRFEGRLLHAADYRNAQPFRGAAVLVVGPGCSGMEIAYDIVDGGARSVWLAVRTPPNLVPRSPPGEAIATALLRLPPRIADAPMKLVRRLAFGDLTARGLPIPEEGIFARQQREGKAPAIVDREVIEAIKDARIQVVAGVESLDATGVLLADGSRVEPDAIVAATGYRRDLERMVGHLGVLDDRGIPRAVHGEEAAPGLRFVGYVSRPGQIGYMGVEAKRAARDIARQLR